MNEFCSDVQRETYTSGGSSPPLWDEADGGDKHNRLAKLLAGPEQAVLLWLLSRLEARTVGRDDRQSHQVVDCINFLRDSLTEAHNGRLP